MTDNLRINRLIDSAAAPSVDFLSKPDGEKHFHQPEIVQQVEVLVSVVFVSVSATFPGS